MSTAIMGAVHRTKAKKIWHPRGNGTFLRMNFPLINLQIVGELDGTMMDLDVKEMAMLQMAVSAFATHWNTLKHLGLKWGSSFEIWPQNRTNTFCFKQNGHSQSISYSTPAPQFGSSALEPQIRRHINLEGCRFSLSCKRGWKLPGK